MNIIIEEVVSEFPVIITEEVVQITISDATSYFDLLEVSDTDFVGKDGYVPVVNEATGKLVLSPQSGGSGGGIADAPNDSNSYVRSALSWVVGYSKTAIDNLLGDKVDKVTGKGLSTEDYTTTEKSKLASITEIFTTALKTTYDDASAWVTDVGLQLKTDFDSLIATGSRLITSAEITKLSNISGTNTGDQDLSGLQPTLTFDTTPTNGSTNPVTSNGVFDALALKADKPILVSNTNVTATYEIDWSKDTFDLTLTGNTTLSETNLPATGTTKVISMYVSGNFAITYPSGWTNAIIGSYVGTKLNQIIIEYRSTGVYFVTINQPD